MQEYAFEFDKRINNEDYETTANNYDEAIDKAMDAFLNTGADAYKGSVCDYKTGTSVADYEKCNRNQWATDGCSYFDEDEPVDDGTGKYKFYFDKFISEKQVIQAETYEQAETKAKELAVTTGIKDEAIEITLFYCGDGSERSEYYCNEWHDFR